MDRSAAPTNASEAHTEREEIFCDAANVLKHIKRQVSVQDRIITAIDRN
jgi:hypothetical protein